MSFIGKLHEISFYGLIANIFCLVTGRTNFTELLKAGLHLDGIAMIFEAYLFWATVLFIPLALIGGVLTKFGDGGEGLTFNSDKLLVIIFAHIAEELLGLFLTPIWFLKDLFTKNFDDGWKVFDYITYAIEIVFILLSVLLL